MSVGRLRLRQGQHFDWLSVQVEVAVKVLFGRTLGDILPNMFIYSQRNKQQGTRTTAREETNRKEATEKGRKGSRVVSTGTRSQPKKKPEQQTINKILQVLCEIVLYISKIFTCIYPLK